LGNASSIVGNTSGQDQRGIARLEEFAKANPDYSAAHESLGFTYFLNSKKEDAIAEMRKAVSILKGDPSPKASFALTLALRQKEEARSILSDLKESSKMTYMSNVPTALCFIQSRKGEQGLRAS
jgi:tetratricopeptide (TPR) repeat protein